jgi:hypothetical protein
MKTIRLLVALAVFGLALGVGLGGAHLLGRRLRPEPETAAVVTRVREVARLETLEVTLYKKLVFAPDAEPAGTLWGDLASWARFTLRAPRGKAIVFAQAHLGLDLARLDATSFAVEGRRVTVQLPPLRTTVELRPADTEIIDSNLDSAETAKLFELAREAFVRAVEADGALQERARASAERAIRGLLLELGFDEVRFGPVAPGTPPS